jgi:hypothetical protein
MSFVTRHDFTRVISSALQIRKWMSFVTGRDFSRAGDGGKTRFF